MAIIKAQFVKAVVLGRYSTKNANRATVLLKVIESADIPAERVEGMPLDMQPVTERVVRAFANVADLGEVAASGMITATVCYGDDERGTINLKGGKVTVLKATSKTEPAPDRKAQPQLGSESATS